MTVNTENKPEPVQNQVQTTPQTNQPVAEVAKTEAAPEIKSEANQTNWKAFREQREKERKLSEEREKKIAEKAAEAEAYRLALEAMANKPQQQHHDIEETDDQKIERRVKEIIEERERKHEAERAQREQQELPQRIQQTFTDFNKICTTENLDYFEYHYPELAAPFQKMPDSFDKWASIYKALKRFIPNTDHKQDAAKAEKNLAKPGSASAPGHTQSGITQPSAKLTEERRAANWERMQKTLKGLT